MNCVICNSPISDTSKLTQISQFAAYGGLPSPCCGYCFTNNDFTIKSHTELIGKSLLHRAKDLIEAEKEKPSS